MNDHWTAEEYRTFLETGKEPVRISRAPDSRPGRNSAQTGSDGVPGVRYIPDEDVPEAFKAHMERVRDHYAEVEADANRRRKEIARAVNEARRVAMGLGPEGTKRSKYGNRKVTIDGITFDSVHESKVYEWLRARKERGELRWVFVHVPFRFMSGVVYWADFMTIASDGTVEAVWDAKSGPTAKKAEYVIKKKTLMAEWGIKVREVTRDDRLPYSSEYYNEEWFSED